MATILLVGNVQYILYQKFETVATVFLVWLHPITASLHTERLNAFFPSESLSSCKVPSIYGSPGNPEGMVTFANRNPLRSPGFVLVAVDSHSVDLNEAEIAKIVISPFIVSYPWQAPISTSVLANMIQEDEKQTAINKMVR